MIQQLSLRNRGRGSSHAGSANCVAWCASLLLLSALLLASCASSPPPQESDGRAVIGFSQFGHASQWRIELTESVKTSFRSDARFNLLYSDANQNQDSQIQTLRQFIARKVSVILFTPMGESAYRDVLNEAAHAGIPVIAIDRDVAADQRQFRLTRVASNFEKEGERAAMWLSHYLIEHDIDDGNSQITVVELQGPKGTEAADGRGAGFRNVASEHPNWRITQRLPGDFTRSRAKTAMATLLQTGTPPQAVHAENDQMALGAIDAIREHGLKPGKDIVVVSEDATSEGLKAVIEGTLGATAECSPFVGQQVLQAVNDVLEGKNIPTAIWTVEGIFDNTNAADALLSHKY